MSSTIINFIINKFLANFLEIDTSKTNVSILTGKIKFENLKIKSEIFQTYNLPYFELLNGYVGGIDIDLKMPFFYNNPIKVKIKEIFVHAKVKNINKLKKEEELNTILQFKQNSLINSEQLLAEIEQMKKQNRENSKNKKSINETKNANLPEIVKKIINNLLIDINDIVVRFDDDLSYKGIPYSIGLILKHIIVRSTRSNFELPSYIDEVIPLEEINYKLAKIEQLSVYMDLFDFEEELNYQSTISNKVLKKISSDSELKNFLGSELYFYSYCMSELLVHSKNFNAHQYLLYQLDLSVKISLNNDINNKKPILFMNAEFPQIIFFTSLNQIKVILKFVAYINLNALYQSGISNQYFNEKLNLHDKKNYVDGYENYFREKYINGQSKLIYPEYLKNMEEHITYNEISQMRSYSLKKIEFATKLEELEKEIKEEKEKILIMNNRKLQKLEEEKTKLLKKQKIFLSSMFSDKQLKIREFIFEGSDEVEDTYVTIHLNFKILMTSLTLYESEMRTSDGLFKYINKAMTFSIQNLFMELRILKSGMMFLFTLENIVFTDDRITNMNYNKIMFGDLLSKDKILCMILEINPKLAKSNLRCKIWSERQMYIILNDYTFQYILFQSYNVFTTTIVLEEYPSYAKDSVLEYIKEGHQSLELPWNFTHANIYLDIFLKCPIILVPIDVFDAKNSQCFLLSLGELKLKSILPPRVELNPEIDYKKSKDENIMYDIYRITLIKTRMSTVDDCTEKNNYTGKETLLLKDIDFSMDCKVLIQFENPNFDNTVINIVINKMFFTINEFQILLIIEFIGNYMRNFSKVEIDNKELKRKEEIMKKSRIKEKEILDKSKGNKIKKEIIEEIRNEIKEELKDKMNLITHKERKKRAEKFYNNFIKSFSSQYHRISNDIKRIHNNKKLTLVDIILKHAVVSLEKNYPDNTCETYLLFDMKLLKIICDVTLNNDIVVLIEVKSVTLFDYDKDENKNFVINKRYQCLIGTEVEIKTDERGNIINKESSDEKNSTFMDYQYLMTGDELNNIVHVNNLHVMASLESMLHMYQFSMYYTEIYLEKMWKVEDWKKFDVEDLANKNKNEQNKNNLDENKEDNLKEFNLKYVKNLMRQDNINRIKFNMKKKNKNYLTNIESFGEYLKSQFNREIIYERKRLILTVLVKVNNMGVKLPIDPKNKNAPLYKMNFNLIYNQNSTYIYTDYYTLPSKRVIGSFYETFTNYMNTSVSNFDMDMIYFLPNGLGFTHNLPEERLLTNFRMSCVIDNFIVLNSGQNVMVIDVVLEPLLFAFGMRQVRKSWAFYFKVMEYIPLLWEKYIPFTKPYDSPEKGKMKKTLKQIIRKIMTQQKIKRALQRKLQTKDGNKKNKLNTRIINLYQFNYLIITNVKSDRIGVIFFDNTQIGSKNILFDVRVKKFICRFLQNTKITDKNNVSNAIYEIITGDHLPITKYNINTLGMYYFIFCSVQMNYHNIITNSFDPLIERFETNVEMMQVAPIFRAKTNIIINDIINYNLSIDSIISLNSFLLKFIEDENKFEIKELLNPIRWRSTFLFTLKEINDQTRSYDIVLQLANNSGIDLVIFFESNLNNRFILKSGETKSFTSDALYRARGLNRKNTKIDRTNLGLYVDNTYPIKNINFQRTNYRQFKINIELNNNKIIPIYLAVIVESSYLFSRVYFSSSIAFFNDTKYEKIIILIKDKQIEKAAIFVLKGSKVYIPIPWLMSQPPESAIYIRFSDEEKEYKICEHISQLFYSMIDDDEKSDNKFESELQKKFDYYKNPIFNKIKDIEKTENFNMKKSRLITFHNNGKDNFLNFDFFLIQSKDIKNLKEEMEKRKEKLDTNKNKNQTSSINKFNESTIRDIKDDSETFNNKLFFPEINYEYVISIRPPLIIVNKTPLTLYFSYDDKNLSIETLKSEELYDFNLSSSNYFILLKIKYFEKFYSSEKIYLTDIETHQYIDLKNENDNKCLKLHMVKKPKDKAIQKPKNYFLETKGYSIITYEFIFFFDYIINNRLTHPLDICPCQHKVNLKPEEIDLKRQRLKPTSLNLISFPDLEQKIMIKDDNSEWSKSFNINTIGVISTIQLDNKFNQTENKELKNEIAIIISSSELYDFPIIIIFEPKFVIINNLGFDVVYFQENNSLNAEKLLKKSEFQILKHENINRHFRIGIYDQVSHITNYSGYFNLDNNEDLDLKIKINPSSSKFPKDSKIFSYNGKEYYILIRIINHSYDKGTAYILLCHPLFPYLEIINNTGMPLKITEKSNWNSFIIYNNNPTIKSFPFAWENPSKYKDDLSFEIYGKKENFSFSVFNEGNLYIKELNLSLTYSVSSRNKTETRSFKIERTKVLSNADKDFLDFILRSKSFYSTSFNCFIKGFGVSLINQQRKEVFYISFYNIKLNLIMNMHKGKGGVTTSNTQNYFLSVDNFQFDYCLNDSYKVIISPTYQMIPSNEKKINKVLEKYSAEFVPLISANVIMKNVKNLISNEEMIYFEKIELDLGKLLIKLEENGMVNLINIYLQFMEHLDYYTNLGKDANLDKDKEEKLDIELHIPIKKLMKENENAVRNLINCISINKIKLDLTLRLDAKYFTTKIPHAFQMIAASFINLGRITNCPLTFSPQKIENIYISWYDLSFKMMEPYIVQGIIQAYRILGSLDIIGNPVNLVQNITEGVLDFDKDPRIAMKSQKMKMGIGRGIVKGFGGLMSGIVGGAFNSVQKFSTTLLVSIQTIIDRDKKEIIAEEENEPENILSGIGQGIYGFGAEIGKSVYNLFTVPCNRAKNEGIGGFCRGLSKGLLGLILSPIAGVLKFVSSFSGGVKNSCFSLVGRKKLKTERFRYPRIIVEGEEIFHPYHENKAEAKEILNYLNKEYTDNILFAEDFICGNSGLGKKYSTAILTDKAIYVIYNGDKLIFEEKLKLIDSIEIHFFDNNYIIKLKKKSGGSTGFKVQKDYSKIATELFDFINPILENQKSLENSFLRRGSLIDIGMFGNLINKDEDYIYDKSSYGKTLSENTYYTLKTLQSKINSNN